MERLAVRGLQIVIEEDPMARPLWRGGPVLDCAGGFAEKETMAQTPPSPRMQALLDSDVFEALLSCTLERCLPPKSGPLGKCHAALFNVESQGREAPANTCQAAAADSQAAMELVQLCSSRSFDEGDSSSCSSCTSHPELSPTSAVWTEWDSRPPPRKRGREECSTGEGEWLSGRGNAIAS